MMNLKYVNSIGVELPLNGNPYWIEDEALFDYDWTVEETNDKISDIKRKSSKRNAHLYIKGNTSSEFNELMNNFYEIVDPDVAMKSPGKIVLDDGTYSSCYIISSKNKRLNVGRVGAKKEISIYFIDSTWIKEVGRAFENPGQSASDGLNFPFNFPFNLGLVSVNEVVWNTGITIPSDFVISFLGNASGNVLNPSITINGYEYKVFTTIQPNQQVDIKSATHEVIRYLSDGTPENIFNSRQFTPSVFKKIPDGQLTIKWNGGFKFGITVYDTRSEPKWT